MKQNNILPNEGATGVDLTEILNLTYTRYSDTKQVSKAF